MILRSSECPMEPIELSDAVKSVLASWSILTILLSILGNTIVLIASLKHKAIKFDKVSVILIENMALADLFDVFFVGLPTTVAILSDQAEVAKFFRENRFGQVVCFIVAHFQYILPLASSIMICALNVSKLLCLMFPLQSHARSPRTGRLIAFVAWTTYLIRFLATVIAHDSPAYGYYEKGFRCYIDDYEISILLIETVMGVLTVMIPGLILVSTLSFLLYYVHKVAGLTRQAVLVNIFITSVFVLSFAPYMARMIWITVGVSPNSEPAETWLWLTAKFINYIFCFSNPLILYLSSASFKSFINAKCSGTIAFVKDICTRVRGLPPDDTQEPLLGDNC